MIFRKTTISFLMVVVNYSNGFIGSNYLTIPPAFHVKSSFLRLDQELKYVENDSINGGTETDISIRREELKKEIILLSQGFKEMQKEMFRMEDEQREMEKKLKKATKKKNIFKRLFSRKNKNDEENVEQLENLKLQQEERMKGLFGSVSFGTVSVALGEKGKNIIELAEALAKLNPTKIPAYGWQGYANGTPNECLLNGKWKLQFTTGADATFRESPKRGKTTTSQEVDADVGTLTNVIDFEKGNVLGFRVVVEGNAVNDKEINLTFRRVIILRKARTFPFFKKRIVIPLPSFRLLNKFVRFLSRGKAPQPRRAFFQIQYIDDNFRMHKTGEGNWFIQTRLE